MVPPSHRDVELRQWPLCLILVPRGFIENQKMRCNAVPAREIALLYVLWEKVIVTSLRNRRLECVNSCLGIRSLTCNIDDNSDLVRREGHDLKNACVSAVLNA